MQVQVKECSKFGLAVFQVWVGTVFVSEFLSLEQANTKAILYRNLLKKAG